MRSEYVSMIQHAIFGAKFFRNTVAALSFLSAIGVTQSYAASHMQTAGRTSQPIGHHIYCKTYKNDCKIRAISTKPTKLTKKRWSDLVEVNSFSNSTIEPLTDLEAFNQEEFWTYPTSYGDCEDYVLMKRHMLMQRGWPASSLLITVVIQPNGEGHAVLTVRTDKADYVLDNLSNKILPWHQTPYTYLKRQSAKHSGRWVDIKGG